MHPLADLPPAEDHQTYEPRFVHEGGDRLIAEDLSEERTCRLRERPVENAEGHFHRDARRDTGREVYDEKLGEEANEAIPALVIGGKPTPLGQKQEAGETDRQRRIEDMQGRDP